MRAAPLADDEVALLRAVAGVLVPGAGASPAAVELPDYDGWLQRASAALGRELADLRESLALLPAAPDWDALSRLADVEPVHFERLAAVTAGAYYMSPTVLRSIGYPTGERVAPPFDLAASELESGILDPVLERGSRVRLPDPTEAT